MLDQQLINEATDFVKSLQKPFLLCVWSHYAKANNKPEIIVNGIDNIVAMFSDVRSTVRAFTEGEYDSNDGYFCLENGTSIKSFSTFNCKKSPFDRTALINWLATDNNLEKEKAYFLPKTPTAE